MRIRKRQVPLPLSALSPVPLSDPLLSRSDCMVQLHSTHKTQSQPSDQLNRRPPPIGADPGGLDFSDAGHARADKKHDFRDQCSLQGTEDRDRGRGDGGQKGNDSRILYGTMAAENLSGSLSDFASSRQVERWCAGDKAFPLKKRRGSFGETTLDAEDTKDNLDRARPGSINTRMSKKHAKQNDEGEEGADGDEEEEEEEEKKLVGAVEMTHSGAKKKRRGGAIMEGSRCSRVNGRGWRCCQQTLVGYSLCEHHLGKGRLRSMTSVRSKSKSKRTAFPPSSLSAEAQTEQQRGASNNPMTDNSGEDHEDENDDDDDDDDDKKALKKRSKKKVKLGMVKARSMSSLLGQVSGATTVDVAGDDDNKHVDVEA